MIPAMIIFAVLASTMLGLPEPLVSAREAGIFRSYKINGVSALPIIVIPAITTIFHTIIASLVIIITAPIFFAAPLPEDWLSFILVFILMTFASAGLGALIGVISSNSRVTVLWSQLVYLPSVVLGGLMLPYSMLPGGMQKVAQLLPATHAMNGFRGLGQNLETAFDPFWSVIILLAGGILSFALALYLFAWNDSHTGRKRYPQLAFLALLPYLLGILFLG